MKNSVLPLVLMLGLLPLFAGEDPESALLKVGDPAEKIRKVLGEPRSSMESADFAIYHYRLGNVQVKSGKVSKLELISEEEWKARQLEEASARELQRKKGAEILAKVLSDEKFAALPADVRLAFWEQFRQDYPDTEIYLHYAQAKVEAEKIQAARAEQQRDAEWEQRVRQLEFQAERAAESAELQRIFALTRHYNRQYPQVIVYPQSYIFRKHPEPTQKVSSANRLSFSGRGIDFSIGGTSSRQQYGFSNRWDSGSGNGVMSIRSDAGFSQSFYQRP
ncbi:MAG: hypothetical protein ACO3N7_02475 [Kiritimatiellia bacterium]